MRIEVGSAARAAEQSRKAESEERGEFKSTVGIRVSRAVGQKFELPGGPASGPGEALPVIPSANADQAVPTGPSGKKEAPSEVNTGGGTLGARLANAWRSLFGRGTK